MDRDELLNDQEEAQRLILDGRQACTWVALPGLVTAVHLATNSCEIQPAIQAPVNDEDGNTTFVNLPLLLDVPIVFPAAGGFALTLPIVVGDEVLVVWASRCIDAWWQSGGTQRPMEARMQDLSDGFAIPGPKSVPNVIPSIDSNRAQLRNKAGTVYLSVGTKFAMKNAATDLKTVLSNLIAHIQALTTLNSDSTTGAVSAASQAVLAADAATLATLLEAS